MEEKPIPKVSILLLTMDRYLMTRYVLSNMLENTGFTDFELLILDNGSSDKRTPELSLEESFPAVQSGSVVRLDENIGIAAGFNQLLKKVKGEYICFLSNDILVDKNWLADLVHYNSEIDNSGLTSIHCEGDQGFLTKLLSHDDSFTRVWKCENNITSGISLINRDTLNEIGAFDEKLGMYGREREQYAHRLNALGFNNYYVPGQYSVHLGRDVNNDSQYKKNKDKALQLSAPQFINSWDEMKKSKNFKIEL